MRLALKLMADAEPAMAYIRLDPGGVLWATDGVALVHSLDAHDGDLSESLYISSERRVSIAAGVTGYRLDVAEGVLYEVRPRSEVPHEVSIERGVPYVPVGKALPGNLATDPQRVPYFDSIRGGAVAHAYGLKVGVWLPGLGDDRVYLMGLDDGDLVVMAGVRMEEK